MYFMDGVILIKEVVVTSLVGNILLAVILIAFTAMIWGGMRLHINGCRNCCDGEKTFGFIMSMVGVVLGCFLLILMYSDEAIISLFDSFGLTDHTWKYEVTLTANVDMNEFQERYEIIDYENGVYTIKEKS